MMRVALLILGVVACGSVLGAPELKGNPDELKRYLHPEVRTVTIAGRAEETAYSDLAHVTLVVTTEQKTLADSLTENSRTRASLTEEILRAGIPADRVSNARFSSSPQYGWFGRKPTEYEVVNRLKVTIESEGQLNALASLADHSESAVIGTIEFEHSAKEAFERRVQQAALDDAVAQSRTYAGKLGLELRPISFSFAPAMPQRPRSSALIEEVIVTSARSRDDDAMGFTPPRVTFDEVEYEAHVEVTFEVLPPGPSETPQPGR